MYILIDLSNPHKRKFCLLEDEFKRLPAYLIPEYKQIAPFY